MARGETYEQFVNKFKPKLTTDDCYTPPEVYDVVARWAVKEYGWEDREIVRPFYPGGDYEHFGYPANCAVIDNPPFSILSKIAEFYERRKIKYFLFAPQLTALVRQAKSHIGVGVKIIYQNGAVVNTGFISSDGPTLRSAPDLYSQLTREVNKLKKSKKLTRLEYPPELVTASKLAAYSQYGVDYAEDKAAFVRRLDSQKGMGKAIFGGGGYLVPSEPAHKAEEALARARARAGARSVFVWLLSSREKDLLAHL